MKKEWQDHNIWPAGPLNRQAITEQHTWWWQQLLHQLKLGYTPKP